MSLLKNGLLLILLLVFACHSEKDDSSIEMFQLIDNLLLDVIDDNRFRIGSPGNEIEYEVSEFIENQKWVYKDEMFLLDSIKSNERGKISIEDVKLIFSKADSITIEEIGNIKRDYFRRVGLDDYVIQNNRNTILKSYNNEWSSLMSLDKKLFDYNRIKLFRIKVRKIFVDDILNLSRGSRTGTNYLYFPSIDMEDFYKRSDSIRVNIGIEAFSGIPEVAVIIIGNDTIDLDSRGVGYIKRSKISKIKKLQMKLMILNPLTGKAFERERIYSLY